MISIAKHFKDQTGFSMAEVVVAFVVFVASVVGVSAMMISGGANVTRGAMETTAANLASKEVEEVKSLPFYVPWDGEDQDIDDFYYNEGYTNAEQFDHPTAYGVDEYGDIPGYPKFKRTTAIQYQYVDAGTNLAPAVMYSSPPVTWVPKDPTGNEIDRPTGGAAATTEELLHGLIIEVNIYYQTDTGEQLYTERALAGDLLITGGENNPILVVTSIDPTSANIGDIDTMTIYVDAVGLDGSASLEVGLWYPGRDDIVFTNAQANAAGTEITADYDLTTAVPGTWNLYVYWIDEGWLDKSFRERFVINRPPPVVTSVDNFNWGYRAQLSRQITVHGNYLIDPDYVRLYYPQGGSSVMCTGTIAYSDMTTIIVNMNMTTVPNNSSYWNYYWDVEVSTGPGWPDGGTTRSANNGQRVLVNPRPQVLSIQDREGGGSDPDFYRKKNYTGTTVIYGRYFQGTGTLPTVYLEKSGQPNISGGDVVVNSITEVNDTDTRINLSTLDLRLSGSGGPFGWGDGGNEVGNWEIRVTNQDGQANQASENRYANIQHAPIAITGLNIPHPYYNWWDREATVNGSYFETASNGTRVRVKASPGGAEITTESTRTVQGDDGGGNTGITVTGAYGTGQGAAGHMNFINMPNGAGTYYVDVVDRENGQTSAEQSFSLQYTNPSITNVTVEWSHYWQNDCNSSNHNHNNGEAGATNLAECYLDGSDPGWGYDDVYSQDALQWCGWWTYDKKHWHRFNVRFRLRGMGLHDSVRINPGARNFWGNCEWGWFGSQDVNATVSRSGRYAYATSGWFHNEDSYDGNQWIRIRNNTGSTGWWTSGEGRWRLNSWNAGENDWP